MAFPSLFAQNKGASAASNTTSHAITMATHAAGDLLMVVFTASGNSTHTAVQSGWTPVTTSPGSVKRHTLFFKIAASSSEALTITTGSATQSSHTSYAVRPGSGMTLSYQVDGTPGNGYSSNTYSGGFSPSAGAQDYLSFTTVGSSGNTQYSGIDYGGSNFYSQAAAGTGGCSTATMNSNVSGTSISDASFTGNSTDVDWSSFQLVIWEIPGGGGGITGTLAATESGSDTIASSGSVRVQGSLASTESGSDTSAIAGAVRVSGSLAASESGSDTAVIIGGLGATGSLNATEAGSDTAALSGVVLVSGSLSVAESGSDTAALSGLVLVQGSLAVTESGPDTFAATGSLSGGVNGSLNAVESGSDTFASTGSVPVSGALSAAESGPDSAAIAGVVSVQGALSVTESGSDTFSAQGVATAVTGFLDAQESGSDTAQILGDGVNPAGSVGHGFVITDTEPKLWWKRKPKALDDEEAEEKLVRVVRVVERIARKQVESPVPAPAKEQKREVREAIAPIVAEMPGFDWMTLYRSILIELGRRQQEQEAAERAQMEIARIQAIRRDEDDVLILLMSI